MQQRPSRDLQPSISHWNACHPCLSLLPSSSSISSPHPGSPCGAQRTAQSLRQLAELLAPLLRQCVSLFAQLLILQDRELVFDLVDFRLRGVGRERGLDRVDGGGLAVGGETSGGPFRTDL
jgi:hypothetical protein